MSALVIVLSVVVAVLAVLVAGLLRGYAAVLRRLHALDGGEQAAPFRTARGVPEPRPAGPVQGRDEWAAAHDLAGDAPDGTVVLARTVAVPHDTVIAFLSSGCAGCVGFWEDLARPATWSLFGGARVVVVTKGPEQESPALLAGLAPPGVDVVMSTAAWSDYDVPGSPYVVVVDGPTGRVKGVGSGTSFRQVGDLVAQAGGDARVRKPAADREREGDVDRALVAAGITPGHPSLYPGTTS